MATVYKRGNVWWVRFQWNGQEIRRSAHTTLKGEAREYLSAVQSEYRSLKLTGKTRVTFAHAMTEYIESRVSQKKLSTIKSYQQCLRVLLKEFSTKKIDEVTDVAIADFEARQQKRVAPSTVKHYRAVLSGIFKTAVRRGWADRNPCRDLEPIKIDNARYRFLTDKEWEALKKALPEPFKSICEVSVLRGMRLGEILALQWSDLNFIRDEITMRDTKNNRPRVIPMEGARAVFERTPRHAKHVFTTGIGTPLRVDNASKEINQVARDAGIENFTAHDLRHTFASWYVQRGGDMYRLQLILGHKGPAMTQRYAHLRVDDLREAAQKSAQSPRDFLH